jgi:hypothetical protein
MKGLVSFQQSLYCDLDLSEQQSLSGGNLGLPVGEGSVNTYSKGEVIGTTRDGYQFTREDLFKIISKTTGVPAPAL